jgi:hypothetical protein
MPPDGVMEPVDVSCDGVFSLLAGLPGDRPDQLRLCCDLIVLKMKWVNATGPSEPATLSHRVVVAVPAPAHRDQDATFAEQGLIVHRAVLGGFNRSSQWTCTGSVPVRCSC